MDHDGERRDYYACLEVGRGASQDDILGSYRRLAMGAHPDAHPEDPGAAGRFREIAEAYEVLGDPKRRADYDRQLGGARIEVQVRRASGSGANRAGQEPWRHHEGAPVFLSATRPRRGDVPRAVSTLWPESPEGWCAEAGSDRRRGSEISELLRRILELWWEI